MRKIVLLLILAFSSIFAQGQNVAGDELRIYKSASIGEDGTTFSLDMNGNKVVNVQDPTAGKDALNLDYFNANALSAGMVFDSIMFNTNISNLSFEKGKLYLDSIFQSLVYTPDGINAILIGRMLLNPLVINNTASLISNLKVVYVDGSISDRLSIQLADKSSFDKSRIIGVTTEDIGSGGTGNVTRFGLIQGNVSALYVGVAVGDNIYLGNDGFITDEQATGGDFNIYIGVVKKLGITDGEIYVNPLVESYTKEVISPRGWSSDIIGSTTLSPIDGTRTFEIIGSGYTYEDGIKYTFDNPSVIWPDIEGTVDVYFDKGVLTTASNQSESQVRDIYSSKSGASRMYWDALNNTTVFANDMRHTFDMNGNTWSTFWDLHKCVVLEGLGIVDIQTGGTGNDAADAQFGHGSGVIRNQDIITSIPSVLSTTGYTVFYREGTTEWRSQDSPGFPILTTGTGRAAWNEDVAGTWQQTEVTNGDFVLYHLFVSNTLGDKTGTVMGQADYTTLTGARTGALTEIQDLLFSQFPISELAPVATVIFETRTNYGNAVQSRTRQSTDPTTGVLVDYIDWTKTNISGGGTGGVGASSFDDLSDTPSVKTGSAGLGVIVNPTEDAVIYAEIARTINGQSPTTGNYNITSTSSKVGVDVTIGTGGTGVNTTFSVADNDNSTTNEIQGLSNTKLNNTITITPTLGGVATTITNIPRLDIANAFTNSITASEFILLDGGRSVWNPIGAGQFVEAIGTSASTLTIREYGGVSGLPIKFNTNTGNVDAYAYSVGGLGIFNSARDLTNANSGSFSASVTASNFISNVATGTQPYATTSTTLNTNLNAQLLNSQLGSYYLDYNNFTNKPNLGLYALLTGATFTGQVNGTVFNATTGIQTAGVTRIDASGNYTGGSGNFSNQINLISDNTKNRLRIQQPNVGSGANVSFGIFGKREILNEAGVVRYNYNSNLSLATVGIGFWGNDDVLKVKASGGIDVTGNAVVSGTVTASNFISNVATGTQPYATTSTTLNTNLNADLLDSQHGSYYLALANSTGTLADGNLSSNVALKNINNTFPTTTFGTNNSTSGTNFLLGKYTSGNIVTFGSERGTSYPFIGYGIKHNENSSGYVSSTPITSNRSYVKLVPDGLILGIAAEQATAEGSPIIGLTQKVVYHSGNSNLGTVPWNASTISTNGTTRIDTSGNYTGGNVTASGFMYANGNTTTLPSVDTGLAISWNRSNGNAEVNFTNTFTSFATSDSYVFSQMTTSSTFIDLFKINSSGIDVTGNAVMSGTVTATNVFKKATQTLSGTTPTYDCSTSVNAKITLTGNTTATLTNLIDGMSGNIRVQQDVTGGRTLTLSPTPKVINGGAGIVTLTGTTNSVDIISWWYDGVNLNVTYGLNYN
jgi:hypothetical protein